MVSVDVLRGLTILLMILVNDPGDPQCVYPMLEHAEWNGYTAADLVFPNFLFLAGVSLVFSLQGRLTRTEGNSRARWEIARGLGRRSVNLLLLKLFLAGWPTFRMRRIRVFGVLFRTALCSLAGGLVLLGTASMPGLLTVIGGLLGSYYLALRLPFGELNRPLLDADNNLAAALDRAVAHRLKGTLHSGALYNITHDPEGLLSSVPAVATVLLGAVAGLVMRDPRWSGPQKATILAAAGLGALGAGHALGRDMPINKNLWTSSYVLAAGGWSLLALSGLYWLLDLRQLERVPAVKAAMTPLRIFGANALVAYAVSVAGHKLTRTVHVESGGHSLSVRTLAYRKTFGRRGSSPLKSLLFAAAYVGLCLVPNWLLWRKKVFVKI